MNRTKLLAVALAALVVATGAAAATPGSTGTADNGGTTSAADASERAGSNAEGAGAAGQDGPPEDLPSTVPDFVSDIHGLVSQFIDGSLDSLGPSVSDAAGNGDAGDDNDDEPTETSDADGTTTES